MVLTSPIKKWCLAKMAQVVKYTLVTLLTFLCICLSYQLYLKFYCSRLGLLAQLFQTLFSNGSGFGSAEGRGLITDLLGGVLGANNDDLANTLTESTDSLTDEQK